MSANSPSPRGLRLILAVACALLVALVIWLWESSRTTATVARDTLEHAPVDADADVADETRAVERVPAAPAPSQPPARDPSATPSRAQQLLELLTRDLELQGDFYGTPAIDSDVLQRLARRAREARICEQELRDVLARLEVSDPRRANVLIAFAWTTDATHADDSMLAGEMEAALARLQPGDYSGAVPGYAALHALRLRGRSQALANVFARALERLGDLGALTSSQSADICTVRIAVHGLTDLDDPAVRAALAQLREPDSGAMFATVDAWRLLGRAGTGAEIAELVADAARAPTAHRFGLEGLRDPRYVADLERLAGAQTTVPREIAPNGYRAESALAGLLSIGTPDALDALAKFAASGDERSRRVVDGLGRLEDMRAVGDLAVLAANYRESPADLEQFEKATERLARQIYLFHPTHPDAREAIERIERAVRNPSAEPETLERELDLWLRVALPGDAARIRSALGRRAVPDELARRIDALR